MMNRPPSHTPWGPADEARETKPGLWWITTPGHGGYWLTPERAAVVAQTFPQFRQQWFEEDCEWSIVDLTFAAEMDDTAVHHAVETVLITSSWEFSADRWEPVKRWLRETAAGTDCWRRYEEFTAAHANLWRRGSLCSFSRRDYTLRGLSVPPDDCWEVGMRRGSDYKTVIMPYPQHEYWTDEEIAAVEFVPQQTKPTNYHGISAGLTTADAIQRCKPQPGGTGLGLTPNYPVPDRRFPKFSETDCGGAFDGFTVTSDADPGL